ncbi:TetR/AcrR family transcriptional regulator [Sporosalibacterium faouarense]|uniref:TetR/AcrR family transcriptional regulator n=1 Tax=Sporosalibacterium faouarense TaxID=516123 RepID=UPI00192CB9F3|nr:TetR/AcrR family transcriptional regulator [Sporosalibacterium faouarense]
MNGFEKRREEKKKAILDAASKLFFKNGYKETNVEEIAEVANVSPASVYNFFDTKTNLYVKTIEKAFYEAMDKYDEILNSSRSFHEKLMAFIKYKVNSQDSMSPDYFKAEDMQNPEIVVIISEVTKTRIIPFFVKLVKQGKEEGAVDESIDVNSVMTYINIFATGLATTQILKKMPKDQKLSEDIGKLFLFGFSGKSDTDANMF